MTPLLSVKGVTLRRDEGEGSAIFNDISFDLKEGEVLILKGRSGCGKTTLLKCLAELDVYQKGEIKLRGKTAQEYGIPQYRNKVLYVPQRPSLLPGTPMSFHATVKDFSSRSKQSAQPAQRWYSSIFGSSEPASSSNDNGSTGDGKGSQSLDPVKLAREWGIDAQLWGRDWNTLSGGEGQRIALAIALSLGGAEIVLLDEPTSALDEESMKMVERSITSMLPKRRTGARQTDGERKGTGPKALVWITHEASQADRVGTRTFDLTA